MAKEVKFSDITIRVLGTESQKVKNLYPHIVNNKQLLRNMGFVISDPNYEVKMEAFKAKKSYVEPGQAPEKAAEPIKEKSTVDNTPKK